MTRKAVQIAISPRRDADSVDVLYILLDDGEVRAVGQDDGEWVWRRVELNGSESM
jgi:hypothetical protein